MPRDNNYDHEPSQKEWKCLCCCKIKVSLCDISTSGNPIGDKNLMIMRTDSISIMGVGRKSWRE